MRFLLDTCVLSESAKPQPDPAVVATLTKLADDAAVISAITVGEIRRGILLLPTGRRRAEVEAWEARVLDLFAGRILPLDGAVLQCWAALSVLRQRQGRPLLGNDGFIAATAVRHGLTLVTRNVEDFRGLDLPLLDPWAAP